ncbi:branched-chain amino acid ABC transporter ATP-binding protein [Bordetella genomosp. 4]|uniref:Branched-chain amino acid ABC transporter ATP-binding protein n=1 Tax=Bordetella genomosp. 4 TaxID=463044 RepID=A0A261TPQ4_9BORD|nr:branched-chain amino acid ABC transporter ATP-binding protein [Bordetella genomosp. 4]OZI51000.1 branched-chain amino acid ABC transporter ATP-binding protein [Bordetella genomosp. 4]
MLEVRDVHASYGDTEVLFGVDMQVDEGEVVAIVGSNGAGKTTLMRTIARLMPANRGDLWFGGKSLSPLATHEAVEQGLVYVPEGRRLFPRLSVRTNLELGAYSPRARDQRDATLETIFQLFPVLKQRESQLAGTLSGGEQQMCAIGRGLMSKPRLLMVDEVSLGLAPVIVSKVYEAIAQIRQLGTTVLLVEQNVRQAIKAADRGYVIKHGRVVLSGSSDELMGNPEVRKAYLGM